MKTKIHSVNPYGYFLPRALKLFVLEKKTLIGFSFLSVFAAMTEGASMTLLIPILESQAEDTKFTEIAIVGRFLGPLDGMDRMDALMALSLVLAGVILLRGILQFGAQALGVSMTLRLQRHLTQQAYDGLVRAQIGFVENKEFAELYTHVREHTQRVAAALRAVVNSFFNLVLMAAYLSVMLALSVKMTLLSMAFVAVVAIAVKFFFIRPLAGIGKNLSAAHNLMHGHFISTVQGMRLIHLRAAEEQMIEGYQGALGKWYASDRLRQLIAIGQSPLIMTASGLFICGLVFAGASLSSEGDTSWISTLLVFVLCLYRMLTPAVAISGARATVAGNAHAMEQIDEFLDGTTACAQTSGAREFHGLGRQGIRIENASFSYLESERAALHGLDIAVEPKSMVALVGPSGAGKSSIVGLLTRFYDPQEGRVLIDGVDIRAFEIHSLRRRISLVTQKTFLFNDTVANNLTFGLGEVSQERIEEAARFAAADEFINELPHGYDTIVGDQGARLSGGQQQRLAIARAFLAQPDLLIFDEATNQLDSVTESVVQRAVESFRATTTIVVVAHRLSTIKMADKIVVLDHGRVVEEGGHDALMAQGGLYCTLAEHQQFGFVDDGSVQGMNTK